MPLDQCEERDDDAVASLRAADPWGSAPGPDLDDLLDLVVLDGVGSTTSARRRRAVRWSLVGGAAGGVVVLTTALAAAGVLSSARTGEFAGGTPNGTVTSRRPRSSTTSGGPTRPS